MTARRDDGRGAAAEVGTKNGALNNADILAFPSPLRKYCSGCGCPFVPRFSSHSYCADCYRWSVAGYHIAMAAAALRDAG